MIKEFIISALLSTIPTVALVASPTPDSFMNALSPDLKLKDMALLGSHDAGTYALDPSMGISPDEHGNFIEEIGNAPIIGPLIDYTIIKAWSKTQTTDITGQLNQGARYFDLRFAPDANGDFRICHGLFGSLFDDIINQINTFLTSHPQEIVLLNFTLFDSEGNDPTEAQQDVLIAKMQQVFGNKIAPSSDGFDVTLGQMWQQQNQVVIFWEDDVAIHNPDILWGSDRFLVSTWYNQSDWSDLETDLNQGLATRSVNQFYVNQAILTPDTQMILTHIFSSLLSVEKTTNVSVMGWYAQQATAKLAGNILMIDNVDSAYKQAFQIAMQYNLQ